MKKLFSKMSLQNLEACPQIEPEVESLPRLAVPKAISNINSSNIRQLEKNLRLVTAKKEISHFTEEINRNITNEEFLATIFRNVTSKQSVLVCSFTGHPGDNSPGKWFARPYLKGVTSFKTGENNYFTLASFNPDSEGKYRRQKLNFAALHALVLDDIGTKVKNLDMLPLIPSWVVQTSPGNYQVGYIFKEPVVDGSIAEWLMNAIIAAGFCDPGAGGPLTRYARLPVGSNGKHDPSFNCQLEEWHPEYRYSINQIIKGFGIKFTRSPEVTQTKNNTASKNDGVMSNVYLPSLPENPVVTKLKEIGLYIKPSDRNGTYEIGCPWKPEHTGTQDGGTYYYEPDYICKTGGFKCFHGHCKDRSVYDLCDYFNINYVDAGNWPIIRIKDGYLNEIVDSIEREMGNSGRYFQRGGEIVTIKNDRYVNGPMINRLPYAYFIRYIDHIIRFERFDKRYNEWTRCNPPTLHSKLLYDSGEFAHLPFLHMLVRQPYLRPDLSLMVEAGYDKELGLYGWFDKNKFPIPNNPTPQQAKKALDIIIGLLIGFRFKSEHDMAAACSAIFAATIRSSLPFCPMFHCRAPQVSSGKSYLCKLISIFSTPIYASAVSFPSSEDECGKMLLALLLSSPEVIFFDNLINDLIPYKSMCSVLTEEYFTNRVLRESKTVTVSTRTLFLSSGNNVGPVRDMSRRVVTIDLDPACENPAQRSFEIDPVSMVLANREYYVSLVLTIIMAWIGAGSPRTNVPPVASYNMWSDLCRQPLLWLGYPDPATSLFRSLDQDPDREVLGRLLHAWYACFKNRPKMIREAIDMGSDDLREVFMDIAAGDRDILNRKRLGRWIGRHASRIVDGLKFEKESGTRSADAWRVESLSSVISVSDMSISFEK